MMRWPVENESIFFFQAEDGIRDIGVTGVQTCALPIFVREKLWPAGKAPRQVDHDLPIGPRLAGRRQRDRKSTRLNSSHANISYAVFCLKKKMQRGKQTPHHRTELTDIGHALGAVQQIV